MRRQNLDKAVEKAKQSDCISGWSLVEPIIAGMIQKEMRTESPNSRLEQFGFSREHGSTHMARTMMLNELSLLLNYVSEPSSASDAYAHAIEENNCLGKRSGRTRSLSLRHLRALYALDPNKTLFRSLRYFWHRDPVGRPMIACLCAYARDPLLRTSAPFMLKLTDGQSFSREALEEYLEKQFPGRFSKATLKSTVRNLASTWTQSGHLTGRVKKSRSKITATAGSVAYALFLGFLTGARGQSLFETDYMKLLDCPCEMAIEFAESASRKGWIVFKRVGNVIEALFPSLLTEQETEWVREQN